MRDRIVRGIVHGLLSTKPVVSLLGRGRQRGDDAALDPQIAAVLGLQKLARIPALESMSPTAARRFAAEGLSPLDPMPAPMASIEDIRVAGPAGAPEIPVRIYVPPGAGPHWIVYFHGGGGVIGSIASSEPAARLLAARSKCTLASVEYRLGPEHRHPAALEDAVAAWSALVTRMPASARAAVAGDSFGGYLAAAVSYEAPARGVRAPDLQVLIYPIVDFTLVSPSIERLGHGYLLTRDLIYWFRGHYFAAGADFRAPSPRYYESLAGSPPAIVVTAGYDPLVGEGDEHAERLRAAGVAVRHHRHPGLIHGFLSMTGGVDAARVAIEELCREIADMLAARPRALP